MILRFVEIRLFALGCLLFALFALQTAGAENTIQADSLVAAGNKHYLSREYGMAIDCYTRVIGMGYEASSLFYNLGNAYYKQNNLPKAILYYEKARLLDPGDDDIRQNLAIANSRIVDKIDNIPEFFLRRWITTWAGSFSPDQWALLSMILFVLALGLIFIYVVSNRYGLKKLCFSAGIILLLFAFAGLLFMRNRKKFIQYSRGAIVMVPVVNVKSSPDEQGTSVFVLHEGTHVILMDSVQHWKEVKIPDGNKGWVPDSVLAGI